jgi:lipopolysaccharide export system protein LptA
MVRRLAVLLFVLLPRVGAAQATQGQTCDLAGSRQTNYVDQGAIIYAGGPVFTCSGGSRILADSAIYVQATGRVDFIGNVRFNDAERTLNADNAQYLPRERRVMAQGNVVLTSKLDGSTLRAPLMDYYQKSDTYPEERIDVPAGRPRATMIRQRANAVQRDTTIVDADRMQIIGERLFRGWGNVQSRRGKLTSVSNYAEFDEQQNRMRLTGQASVQSDTFRLRADSIEAVLADGDQFKELHAYREVILDSEQVDLTAPVVRLSFADGEVERIISLGGSRVRPGAPLARAVSPDFVLVADSIDALSPKQKLQRVIAIGRARGERTADSIADRNLPALIRNDWVQGDTVLAYFGARKDTATTDSSRVLERIVAMGSPASSTYRMREQVGDSVELSVNYLTAKKLDVTFKDGAVQKVAAEGEIRGLYLQPPARAQATPLPGRQP